MKRLKAFLAVVMLSIAASGGDIPMLFPFEGEYFVNGTPYTNSIILRLQLFDAPAGGNLLYEDSNSVVQVSDGYYFTYVGDDTATGSMSNALASGEVYVQAVVDGTNQGNRIFLAPTAYALRAASIPSNSICSALIQNEAVQAAHLANGTVGVAKLAPDVDARYLNVSGDAMAGTLNMSGQQITNTASISLCGNPSFIPLIILTNYYSTLFVKGVQNIIAEGGISTPAFSLSENELALKCIQRAYNGALLGTNYTAKLSTTTNVMNEIRVTGHFNMQGNAISNGVFVGDGSGLVNLPEVGLSTNTADGRYINAEGDTMTGAFTNLNSAYLGGGSGTSLYLFCGENDEYYGLDPRDDGLYFRDSVVWDLDGNIPWERISVALMGYVTTNSLAAESAARIAADGLAFPKTGGTMTGPLAFNASANQTNLTVSGWAKIDYVPPQGGISMGVFTDR